MPKGPSSPPHPDVEQWLAWLMAGFGDGVLELRVFPRREKSVLTGYFRTPQAAATALAPWDGRAQIYAGLNPRIRKVWRQAPDMLRLLPKSGNKAVVAAIHHVLLDFDPERPQGVPSSREELERARDRAKTVAAWLKEQGAGDPLAVSSGNGFHLLYKIPPQDPQTFPRRLQAFLRDVARRFGGDGVEVDQKVWDAPRIVKVGGTISIKGTPSKDRPHRRARIAQMIPPEPDEGMAALILRYDASTPRASPSGARAAPPSAQGADPEAVAQLVASYWTPGQRHTLALGLAGLLAKNGWPEDKATEAVAAAARAAGDEEEHDRIRAVEDTYRGLAEGKEVAGAALLEGALPPQVFAALSSLVRASRGNLPKVAPITALRAIATASLPPSVQRFLENPPRNPVQRRAALVGAIKTLQAAGYTEAAIRMILAQHARAFPPRMLNAVFAHREEGHNAG